MTVHAAIIEWDSSNEPTLLLGVTWRSVVEPAIAQIIDAGYMGDDEDFFTDPERPENHVNADSIAALTDQELQELNERIREATTVPWLTILTSAEIAGLDTPLNTKEA